VASRPIISAAFLAAALAVAPLAALAGAQAEEELAHSVVSQLSRAIADNPVPADWEQRPEARTWIDTMSARLASRMPSEAERRELLRSVHYESVRAGLDPQLVLAVIDVESHFRKYAVSRSGARGLMQVMPFWVKLIGQPTHNLFHLRTNLAYGCAILRHYLDMERGDYFRALGRYNGTLGKAEYPQRVLTAWKGRWKYDPA